jgi:hypothetical protein
MEGASCEAGRRADCGVTSYYFVITEAKRGPSLAHGKSRGKPERDLHRYSKLMTVASYISPKLLRIFLQAVNPFPILAYSRFKNDFQFELYTSHGIMFGELTISLAKQRYGYQE